MNHTTDDAVDFGVKLFKQDRSVTGNNGIRQSTFDLVVNLTTSSTVSYWPSDGAI